MDGAQARVQEAVAKMVNSLDTGCLRKMQVTKICDIIFKFKDIFLI